MREDPASCVDPFIDTAKERIRWVFTLFTVRPCGMVRLAPDTDPVGTWNSGYRYGSDRIRCFSHIHSWQISGAPIMPAVRLPRRIEGFETFSARFSHESEIAHPGYYRVRLAEDDIAAELTATRRAGFHRYGFPSGSPEYLTLNLGDELGPSEMSDVHVERNGDRIVRGYVENETTRRRPYRCRIYFVLATNKPIVEMGGWEPDSDRREGPVFDGPDTAIYLGFGRSEGGHEKPLLTKVGFSFTGCDAAEANLEHEIPHWDFDRIRREAWEEWNRELGVIEIEGGRKEDGIKLYTDLWRVLGSPQLTSDASGTYCDNTRGTGEIRTTSGYDHVNGQDGFWNSQWSVNLLFTLAYPEIMSLQCRYLLDYYRDGGLIPRGPSSGGHTFVMIAAPTTPFVVSAYMKGIRDFDIETAYEGMLKNAGPGGLMSKAGYEHDTCEGGGIEYYLERGYIPEGRTVEGAMHVDGAAQTLEYAYQDWAFANLAGVLGRKSDQRRFLNRSNNYRNIFDGSTGFMRPRNIDGSWIEPFDPLALEGFCEANSWQYSFHVPQNIGDLISMMGGKETFVRRLDEAFQRSVPMSFYAKKPELERDKACINYGNEPGRYVAHLFNHAGAPYLAQKWARAVKEATFGSVEPLGFCEDDDIGKAAATSLLLSIGLFDLRGGVEADPVYELTTPVFDRVTIHLDRRYYAGERFFIVARNNAPGHVYIRSARLNGTPLSSPWIYHRDVVSGATLELELDSEPNESWGTNAR